MSRRGRPKQWMTRTLQGRRWLMEKRLEAVEANDVAQLRELFSYQSTHRPRELTAALQTALLQKSDSYSECVQLLLTHGASSSGTTGAGTPFLVLAADAGCTDTLAMLLEADANVNQPREDGATALHRAACNARGDCVLTLLKSNADPDLPDSQGRTPLLLAAQANHSSTVSLLLEAGGSPSRQDYRGRNALHWACTHGNRDLLVLCLEAGCDVNAPDSSQTTPLMIAAREGRREFINKLVYSGADVDATDNDNYSALLFAAANSHTDCVKTLIATGCDVNCCAFRDGSTALLYMLRSQDIVKELLYAGAEVSSKTSQNLTPLWIATCEELEGVVKWLLKANCDVCDRAGPGEGKYPLEVALYRGSLRIVQYLFLAMLIAGANLLWLQDYLSEDNFLEKCRASSSVMTAKLWLEGEMEEGSPSLCAAQSLMHICRWTVREELGSAGLFRSVNSLPIPNSLKDYLKLSELDDL